MTCAYESSLVGLITIVSRIRRLARRIAIMCVNVGNRTFGQRAVAAWTVARAFGKFTAIMKTKLVSSLRTAFPIFILLFAIGASAQGKRPLTHQDYDGWHNIQNQTLSNDG